MCKRILGSIILSCLLSAPAHAAWFLNTWAKSAGGTIVVRGGTPQTSVNSSVYNSYTTSKPFTVIVSPNVGYSISQVNYNNVVTSSPSQTSYTVQGPGSQNVFATFAAQALTVTASTGAGGSVNLASLSGNYYGTTLYAAKKFTFTPSPATFRVAGISGVPAGATVSPAIPAAANTPVTVTLPVGFTFTSNIALYGTFSGPPVAKTGPPQVVVTGSQATLDGSSSTGSISSYSWTQTAGPGFPASKVIADNTSGAQTSFTPAIAGSYTFRLTVTGGSTASATVTATDNLVDAGRVQCYTCHLSNGIGIAQNVFGNWSTSLHRAKGVICSRCHIGANAGGHPGQLTSGSVSESTFNYNAAFGTGNFCATCHSPAIINDFAASKHSVRAGSASCSFCHVQGVHNPNAACVDCHNPGNSLDLPWPPSGLDFHNDYTGTNLCTNCHNLHNPAVVTGMAGAAHYNNITSGIYPASYVTSRAACTNCHVSNPANATVRHQWAKSRHAAFTDPAWMAEDFKTMPGCVQCHTTTGFIAYSTVKVTAAWGVASDKTKEVLRCNGCHSNVEDGIVRTVTPVKPFAADNYVNRTVGPSNICMDCHSGTNNGLSITSADFSGQAFIAPHYLAAGGILHGKGGYNFPGQTYAFYSSNTHRAIGMENNFSTGTDGPCIGCHMSASQKHRFKAVSSATNGAIGKITTGTCANCHGSSLDDTAIINARQASFANALEVLKQTLAYRGFNYSPTYPYFSNTNWTYFPNAAHTMGAAFNYVLLLKEPGAYAHNSAYAKQLAFDSIDYLYNGTITGSIDTAVAGLVGNGITQGQADSLIAYKSSNSCSSCHANSSGSHPAHLDSGFGCADCHSATAATNTTLVPGTTTHLNGVINLLAGPARSFSYSAGTCSSISCHNNGSANWGTTLGCSGCHAYPPAYVNGSPKANSHANHGFGCGTCHAGTTSDGITISNISLHVNGMYDVTAGAGISFTYTYGATGGTCNSISCHGNSTATWGSVLGCTACHGNDSASVNPIASGKHQAHMNNYSALGANNNFSCIECHASTVSSNQAIGNRPNHGNGIKNYSGAKTGKITVAGSGKCNSNYCHGTGQKADVATFWNMTAANWYSGRKLDCTGCHGNAQSADFVPVAGAPNYPNGGVGSPTANSHNKHVPGAGIVDSTGCAKCHYRTVDSAVTNRLRGYSTAHINRVRDVNFSVSASISGVQGRYSSASQQCMNTYCHGAAPSPNWGSSSLSCTACHAAEINGFTTNNAGAHKLHYQVSTPPASGTYASMPPGQGSSATAGSYQFNCSSCHATPATHAGGEAVLGIAAAQVYFGYSTVGMKGTYSYNVTQGSDNGFNWTNGTCATTYCHSNGNGGVGNNTGYTWTTPQGTLGCIGCHGGNATSGTPITTNKHAAHINNAAVLGAGNNFACRECHSKTVASDTTIGNKLAHVNKYKDYSGARAGGSASYSGQSCSASYCHSSGKKGTGGVTEPTAPFWTGGSLGCDGCHGVGTGTGYPNYASGVAGSTSANSHAKHVIALSITTTTGCATCHAKTVDSGSVNKLRDYSSSHLNRTIDVNILAAYGGTFDGTSGNKTCTNVYCHSNGSGGAALKTAQWGDTLTCSSCHGGDSTSVTPIATGRHGAHINNAAIIGTNFACAECHAKTVSLASNTSITNPALHVNTFKDFSGVKAGNSGSYNSATGVCSATYCHSDGKGTAKNMATDNWKAATTLGCNGCHGSDPAPAFSSSAAGEPNYVNTGAGTARANSHQKHTAAGITSCDTCHTETTNSGAAIKTGSLLHANGTINVTFNTAKAGQNINWTPPTKTCANISCHGNTSATWGSTLGCTTCHGNPPAYPNGSPKANSHGSHNLGCGTCHADTASNGSTNGTTISNSSLHGNGVYNVTPSAGTTFTYTYASTGGTCNNVSCHAGLIAKWGTSDYHIAEFGNGSASFYLSDLHDGGSEYYSEPCSTCHYANILVQHNNNCATCHSGSSPAAAGALFVNGRWDKNCSSGSCHPSIHPSAVNHDFAFGSCDTCHANFGGTFYGCTACHSQTQTLTAFITNNPSPVDTPAIATNGNIKLLLHMDEAAWNGTPNEVKDSSGWNNHGTAYNGANTVAGGVVGRAGSFNGVNSNVVTHYALGTTPVDNFTLEAWVKPNAPHEIDSELDSGVSGTSGQNYLFWPDYSGDLDGGAGVSVGTNGISVYELGNGYMPALAVYSGAISSSQWTHIAVVYANKRPSIYINGALVRIGLPSPRQHVYAPQIIGGEVYGWYSGLADEAIVYDVALSSDEVLQHAQQLCTATSNSAVAVGWTSANASSSYVDYGLTTSYGTTAGNSTLVTTHTVSLAGLAGNTTYHYRVRSTTAGGAETVSGDNTFTTSSSCSAITDPPAAPTGISATAGVQQATISWSVGTGTSSSLIRYGTSSGNLSTIIDPATSPQAITGLVAGTAYYFQVGAKNTAGTTWDSTVYTATPLTPSAPTVTSPTSQNVLRTTAYVGANVTSNGGATLSANGICWGLAANPTINCVDQGSHTVGIFNYVITGLTEGSLIYIRGYATNSAGTGYSPDGAIYTEPLQPTTLSFTSVGPNGLTINWVTGSSGNARNVIVLMKAGTAVTANPVDGTTYTANAAFGGGSQIGSTGYYVVYKGTGTSIAVTGLTASTTYQVKVYAFAAGASGTENYNLVSPLAGSRATSVP